MTIKLAPGAVLLGPNTLSGTPQSLMRDGKSGNWGEFCTPWADSLGNEFNSNAARVAIWFRSWDEAQEFIKQLER